MRTNRILFRFQTLLLTVPVLVMMTGFAWGGPIVGAGPSGPAATPTAAPGDPIIGISNVSNCIPFSCGQSDGILTYQQVYADSAFSGPLTFNTISFYKALAGAMDTASYSVYFSYTSQAVNGLSSVSPSANIGSGSALFGNYNLSGNMPTELDLTGNAFSYNPLNGNLLMTVDVGSQTDTQVQLSFFEADSTGNVVSRAFFTDGKIHPTGADTTGLVTGFSNTTPTPEPPSWTLAGAGVLLLGGLFWADRRRHARVSC